MALKKEVARRLVARYHGEDGGVRASEHFRRVVQSRQVPDDVSEVELALEGESDLTLLEVLERLDLVASRSEARRLAKQGALAIDGERVLDPTFRMTAGRYLLKVGKRRFARVNIS